MTSVVTALGVALVLAGKPAPPPDNAADLVTLRDGSVVRGQFVESPQRLGLTMIVRREWARKSVPELAKRWEADEKTALRRAAAQRRERLQAWKRERPVQDGAPDGISAWIASELTRMDDPEKLKSPLMVVTLSRGNVRGIVRRPPAQSRLLLLGWRIGFDDAESLSVERLTGAVESRGFSAAAPEPVSVAHLLPIQAESDIQWLARRAATEVRNDPGLRFIRVQNFVMAEPAPGEPVGAGNALAAIGDLKRLFTDEDPGDPLTNKLDDVAKRGRVGAVVTQQSTAPDMSSATVEMTLLMRDPRRGWIPVIHRSSTVRASEVQGDEMKNIEQDPQVQSALKILQSLGLGDITDELKKTSLNMGAAVQRALGQTRSTFENDLRGASLPIERAARNDEKGKQAPMPQ